MVYTESTYCSQFRIQINKNYIWQFLGMHEHLKSATLDVQRLAERLEDELSLVDILDAKSIPVESTLKRLLMFDK